MKANYFSVLPTKASAVIRITYRREAKTLAADLFLQSVTPITDLCRTTR